MKDGEKKKIDLGRTGKITYIRSKDDKYVQIAIEAPDKGLDKSDLGAIIDALRKIRDKMER